MRLDPDGALVLSRRNLMSLLVKLDGHPLDSFCTLIGGEDAAGIVVRAEPDDIHYGARGYPPGPMHNDTEVVINADLLH